MTSITDISSTTPAFLSNQAGSSSNESWYAQYQAILQLIQQMGQDVANQDLAALQKDYAALHQALQAWASILPAGSTFANILQTIDTNAAICVNNGERGQWSACTDDLQAVSTELTMDTPFGIIEYFIQTLENDAKGQPGLTAQDIINLCNAQIPGSSYSLLGLLKVAQSELSEMGLTSDANFVQSIETELSSVSSAPPSAEALILYLDYITSQYQNM